MGDKLKILGICALLIVWPLYAALEVNGDGSPIDYSKIGVTARYWGMGRAGVAWPNDSGGLLLNPAGLGILRSMEFSSMSTNLMGEINYSLLNMTYPLKKETIGLSLLYQNAGTIYATNGLDQYGHPVKGDTIDNYTTLLSVGYGRQLFLDNLYLGVSLKSLRKQIDYVEAYSTAIDLGAIYLWRRNISFGFVVKNAIQTDLTYSNNATAPEHIDSDYILGAAYQLMDNKLILAADAHINPKFGRTRLGAEYTWSDMVSLRAGLAERDMTLGVGFRYKEFQVDYGLLYQEAPLENQAFISVTWGDAKHGFVTKPEIELVEEDAGTKAPATTTPANKPSITIIDNKNQDNNKTNQSQQPIEEI